MIDILLDNNDDIILDGCEITVGEATSQTAHSVLRAHQGEFKSNPGLGANADSIVNGSNPFFEQEAKTHLLKAGIKAKSVSVAGNDINVQLNN